ncbi:hypothetical protein B0I35DRAFT_214993 [Stachybotrys elegans]|uniref:FAD-binding domain-containing protein n=1 Tax=Stachybotrys elegans TaxID=80388 RepID=A0A8K0SMU4_9HYPO|nr:hypothetical protein B0I35DRAFT_214993 [Stachybotrys elegans]
MPAHVLIVGAGLGGLALAQGLKKHGVDFTLYERDANAEARAQGYRIKIFPDSHPDLAFVAPQDLVDEIEATSAETVMVESMVNAVNAQPLARRALRGFKPWTVDRGFMRKVLLKGLEDKIHWAKEAVRYETSTSDPDKPVTVHFADGTSASGSLLVGADGNHSPIRKQLVPKHKIIDPEGVCLYGRTYLTPELRERLDPSLLRGLNVVRDVAPVIQQVIFDSELPISMFIEKMHFPRRARDHPELPDDYMYWSMLVPSKALGFHEQMIAGVYHSKTAVELNTMLTAEWHPSIRCLIDLQDAEFATKLRVISSTPDVAAWESSPCVTLLGDAIHVMSPSGAVGAATALKDAVALIKAITGPEGISQASIQQYESDMREVAKAAIDRSFRGGKLLYGQPPLDKCTVIEGA